MPGTNTEYSSWSLIAGFPKHLNRGAAFQLSKSRIILFDPTCKSTSAIFDVDHQTTVATRRFNFSLRYKGAALCVAKDGQDLCLYSLGGFLSNGSVTQATQGFDLTLSKWRAIANLRTARHGAACVRHEDRIYVFGGTGKQGSLNGTAEVLKVGSSRFNKEVRMSTPRTNAAAVRLCDEIYLLGGDVQASEGGRETTNTMDRFNALTHEWKESPAMRFARKNPLAIAIGNRAIVVIGGTGEDGQPVSEVEIYDPKRQQWGLLGRLNDPRLGLTGCAFGTDIYIYCAEKLELWKLHVHLDALDQSAFDGEPETIATTTLNSPFADASLAIDDSKLANPMFKAALTNPIRPRVQSAQDVPGRILALERWISSMKSVKEAHEANLEDTVHRIEQAFNEQRDLEICCAQRKAQAWLDETDRLLADAQQQIVKYRALTEQHSHDKSKLCEIGANDNEDGSGPPRELCCPITLAVMHDPVLAADGNTYEREALERWFAKQPSDKKPKSPMTGSEMESRAYFPNHAIRSLCQHFHSTNADAETTA